MRKRGPKKGTHWKVKGRRMYDGYKVHGTEMGGYTFCEGLPVPVEFFLKGEARAIDLCALSRGIRTWGRPSAIVIEGVRFG